jgi:hypothetical protein
MIKYSTAHRKSIVKEGGSASLHSPAWEDFTLMKEFTPESGHCCSVFSEVETHARPEPVVINRAELKFLNTLWGARNRVGIGLSYRPARLHRLAEFIPWNRFLVSVNV